MGEVKSWVLFPQVGAASERGIDDVPEITVLTHLWNDIWKVNSVDIGPP
jgi:hypothetical protein